MQGNCTFYYEPYLSWQVTPDKQEVYVINRKKSQSYILSNTGKDVWLKIGERKKLYDIADFISEKYENSSGNEQIRQDISIFIEKLIEEGLVKIDGNL